jgi:MFS family permease
VDIITLPKKAAINRTTISAVTDFASAQGMIRTVLFGLAIGSMFMAPLSEVYGRKPVCVICLAVFTVPNR